MILFFPPPTGGGRRGGAKNAHREPRGRGASGAPPKRRPSAVHSDANRRRRRRQEDPPAKRAREGCQRRAQRAAVGGRSALTKPDARTSAAGGLSAERKRERTRELNAPVARCETHVRDTEARESDSPRKRGREATRKRDAEAARQTCKQSSSAQAGIHCFVWWNRATPERDCICISSVSQGR